MRRIGRRWTEAAAAILIAVAMSGCAASSELESPDAGRTTEYVPGVPNFDMEALVRIGEDGGVVDVRYSLPISSLVFVRSEGRFEAGYELVVRLLDRESGSLVAETSRRRTLTVSSYDSTLSFHPHLGRTDLDTEEGLYVVEAIMTDLQSGESAARRQAVDVAALGAGESHVGRILLEGRRPYGSYEPIISLHMPSAIDSLRASVEIYNITSDDLAADMSLVRFESDTTVASPPYWLEPPRGSLEYEGIDYGRPDTVQSTSRLLRGAEDRATVEFALPRLESGVYRLRIGARDAEGAVVADRERMLSVKSATFPRMTVLEDLIDALAYIAYDDEIHAILEGSSALERKRRFDAFWGSLVSNRNVAANLIELYYGRIEEANLFFSGYKEGWKTDRGMIFTVLGPPVYVDRRIDSEIWFYSYGDRDPANTFVFERVPQNDGDAFESYVLQRRPYYQNEWGRAIDRWRAGQVL